MSLKVLIILAVHMMSCINTHMKSQATTVKRAYNLISYNLISISKVHIINTYGI